MNGCALAVLPERLGEFVHLETLHLDGCKITEDDVKNCVLRALPEALGGPTVIADTGVS